SRPDPLVRADRAGNVAMNAAPCPRPALSARMLPPCNSTMWRAIASPKPRPPSPRGGCIGLTERLKYVWQELRTDSDSGIRDTDFYRIAGQRSQGYRQSSALRSEFNAIEQQVPHDLLQPPLVCPQSRDGAEMGFQLDSLGIRGRTR